MAALQQAVAAVAAATEAELESLLPAIDGPQGRLHEAMRYTVLSGGKRLRPFLVVATAETPIDSATPLFLTPNQATPTPAPGATPP